MTKMFATFKTMVYTHMDQMEQEPLATLFQMPQ